MGPTRGLGSRPRRGSAPVQHDETTDSGERPLARERGAGLAAFYDRRAAAALAYCSRLCAPEAIADAVEAAFARVFEAAAAGEDSGPRALDARLRSAVRSEAARRASPAGAGVPARRLLERLADPSRGPDCRVAEQRFDEAERAFDALAGDDAPALGRSLLAEMLTDAPLSARRRFARERLASESPDWLQEIDWGQEPAPRVVEVPEDALEEVGPPAPEAVNGTAEADADERSWLEEVEPAAVAEPELAPEVEPAAVAEPEP